ncbi:VCBS repeat-containing protein [Clostridium botulinum]|nr:VCBS repeat-containing protein [Clostridium botulinum]NEZ98342.1 VCBS repeat-containing protein [Clostridium botulinum]NFA30099.1 VCBS repeat-containing protein [Clostridium botulinum]NFA84908.1 VCBS repeat-containing protein [Clostridium botulinum]NFB05138.1 VCBS repeat-containing protein [Clostridium botulinum]
MFYCPYYFFRKNMGNNKVYIIDRKKGDVNGDKVEDTILLIGNKPSGTDSPFVSNIRLVIKDGKTGKGITVPLKENSGYNPTIFLGDFTGDKIKDILVSIDSGGSGGFAFYYIYSFANNQLKLIFDFEKFGEEYTYEVNYKDNYKVEVISENLKIKYIIDITYKGKEYLNEIYDLNGKLKEPISGFVIPLSNLYPIDFERDGTYELYIFQRIAGRYNADGLGYVQTALKWEKDKFTTFFQNVGIQGKYIEG